MFPLLPGYPEIDEVQVFGRLVRNTLAANSAYTRESAEAELQKGIADLITFGVLFLANPDLPKRFERNAVLNEPDRVTMYGGAGAVGYTDFPFLDER